MNGVLILPCGARDEDRKRGLLSSSGDSVRNEKASDAQLRRHFWRISSNSAGMILVVPRRLAKRTGCPGKRRGLPSERGGVEHSGQGRGTLQ